MKRDAGDFHRVDSLHGGVHARLLNWARYVSGGRGGSDCHPMFRQYRSSEVWGQQQAHIPVDTLDGSHVEKHVSALPEKHRDAVRWQYVYSDRGCGLFRVCRMLAVSQAGLEDLINDGRTMLKNRISKEARNV